MDGFPRNNQHRHLIEEVYQTLCCVSVRLHCFGVYVAVKGKKMIYKKKTYTILTYQNENAGKKRPVCSRLMIKTFVFVLQNYLQFSHYHGPAVCLLVYMIDASSLWKIIGDIYSG